MRSISFKHLWLCFFSLCLMTSFSLAPLSLAAGGLKLKQAQAETKKPTKKATKKTSKSSSKRVKKTYGNTKKSSSKKISVQKQVPQDQTNRWAAIVVDANEGRVLYEKNADKPRYPASLTKMMTLYLLFDALENNRVSMQKLFNVSEKAAGQPPTNIALAPGDSVSVETAILALIIRSANDVAMVVAENLGGSQEGFARMMNRKAKELGMNDTVFYNPSGLPDDRQVTTASDLARLSIALRRDFPQYYSYFKRPAFQYNGRTYTTHNRVVGRYPGADGLKTGYIRASGFNLATSVTRGNTRLVGVVMGGTTASSRDQEMMNMLDRTIFAMNKSGGKSYASFDKETKAATGKKDTEVAPKEDVHAAFSASQVEEESPSSGMGAQVSEEDESGLEEVIQAKANETKPVAETQKPQTLARRPIPQLPPIQKQTLSNTLPHNMLSEKNWAIQVGAYPTLDQAERAAKNAKSIAGDALSKAQMQISQVVKDGRIYNRSRMIYLSSDEAKSACDHLISSNKVCMVVRMEN